MHILHISVFITSKLMVNIPGNWKRHFLKGTRIRRPWGWITSLKKKTKKIFIHLIFFKTSCFFLNLQKKLIFLCCRGLDPLGECPAKNASFFLSAPLLSVEDLCKIGSLLIRNFALAGGVLCNGRVCSMHWLVVYYALARGCIMHFRAGIENEYWLLGRTCIDIV